MDKKISKNSKLDLIWIIPEIIGTIGIAAVAVLHIGYTPSVKVIGLAEWIFQMVLVLVVVDVGLKGFGKGCDELKKVFNANQGDKNV